MWPPPAGRRLGLALGPLGRRHCHPGTECLPPKFPASEPRRSVKSKEDPAWAIELSYLRRCECRDTRVRSTAPSQHMLAQHVGDLSCPHDLTSFCGEARQGKWAVARLSLFSEHLCALSVGHHGVLPLCPNGHRQQSEARDGRPACCGPRVQSRGPIWRCRPSLAAVGCRPLSAGCVPESELGRTRFRPRPPGKRSR